MGTILTRVSYCPHCYARNRPRSSQLFVVHGSTSNQFGIKEAMKNGVRGYTPHTLELLKVDGGNVIYRKACGMNGCDTQVFSDNGELVFRIETWTRGIITLEQWNAWVTYKHDTDYQV